MTIPKLTSKAQKVFNTYIRRRDSEGGYFTCISCSRTLPIDKMNAGHFVPVKNSSFLRFDEYNVNGECAGCNAFDKFHLIGYKNNLTDKIGIKMVKKLEKNSRQLKKWTREELNEIISRYK